MVTTRSDTQKARRVTRSMAATKSSSSRVTTRKTSAAPNKTAQTPKTAALKKVVLKNVAIRSAPALEGRTTNDTNRELLTEMINNDATIRPVTRSMSKKVNQTAAIKPSTTSTVKKPSVKASTRPNAGDSPAARPVTRSMRNEDEDSTINVPPEPDPRAPENLTAPSRRVASRMAEDITLTPPPSTINAPIIALGARNDPGNPSTTVTPRARIVRPGFSVSTTTNQERFWAGRNRAALRRALEGDREWADLTHGQRREMIRLFAWVESEPGRTLHDYFDLPVRHAALTTRPNVEHSVGSSSRCGLSRITDKLADHSKSAHLVRRLEDGQRRG